MDSGRDLFGDHLWGQIWVHSSWWWRLHRAFEDSLFLVSQLIKIETWRCRVRGWGLILGLWPWICCSCKATSVLDFCLWSYSKVLSKCSAVVTSSVKLVTSQPIFCLFINPWVSGDKTFTNSAARAGWVASFLVWNLECCTERASFQTGFRSLSDSSFFCSPVWIIDRSMWAGETLGMAFKRSVAELSAFSSAWGDSIEDWTSNIIFRVLLPCFLHPFLGFTSSYQHVHKLSIKIWWPRVSDPNNDFLRSLRNFRGSSLCLGNSLAMAFSLAFDQGVKDTWRGSPATTGGFYLKR